MSEKSIVCKCMVCLRENVNGVLLNIRTYYRHRKNQLEFSDVEEIHIIHQKKDLEDMQQQDELQQQNEIDLEDMQVMQQDEIHYQENTYQQENKIGRASCRERV